MRIRAVCSVVVVACVVAASALVLPARIAAAQAPFSQVEYQGEVPAFIEALPVYTSAHVSRVLAQHAHDPLGLPGEISSEAARFTETQLLRMVPRLLVTSVRGEMPQRPTHVMVSPARGTDVFATALVHQGQRNAVPRGLESRLQFTIGQGSRSRLLLTGDPLFKLTMAREDDGSTLVPFDPSREATTPDAALTVRFLTTLAGGPSALYTWVNNVEGAHAAQSKTNAGRGPRMENAATGTPWFTEGDYSAFELLQQVIRVELWNGDLERAHRYDSLSVLTRAPGGYRDGGVDYTLYAFGVDWQSSRPRFLNGYVAVNLHLTYDESGPEKGRLKTLTLSLDPRSDFDGAAGIGVVPLFNPKLHEQYSTVDPRVKSIQYNFPGGGQTTRTADMAAITKGVHNNAKPSLGTIPYTGL